MPIFLFPNGTVELESGDLATGVHLVDSAGNTLSVGGSGGTSSTDDGAFTAGASSGTPIMGFATSDAVDAGDVGVLAMLTNRQLKVTLYDSSGVEASVGGGTQYDEDTASANAQKLTMAGVTRADTAASQVNSDGDRSTLIVDASGRLHVNVGNSVTVGSHEVTNAGTFAVQVTSAPSTAVTNAGLTELAAAINGSSQMDVNIAASNATVAVSNTGLTALNGAISGTEVQVDVLTMPTTTVQATNLDIRDLTSASDSVAAAQSGAWTVRLSDGTDTADVLDLSNSNPLAVAIVDSSGDQISSFGGGTQYTEDAAAAANPVGTAVNLVRADTPATITTTDGDNVAARGTNYGAMYVTLLDTGGTEVAVGGGTQYTEDAAAAANPIGTALNLIRADSPAGVTTTDGDNLAARGTDFGALYVTLLDSGGGEVAVGGGTQYTQGDTDASITGTAMLMEVGSDTLQPVQGTVADGLLVNLGSNNDVTVTGTVTANLAAGTNNIGDVDVLSVVPGTGATALGKAIDTALGATDTGVLALTVRDDTLATLTEADGDVSALRVDSTGRLWANVSNTVTVASHAVTNAGTFAVQVDGAALTSLQLIDDTVTVLGTDTYTEATSKGLTIGAVRRDADTTLVNTTNEFGPLQMDANGRLKVEAFSGETLPVSDSTAQASLSVLDDWDESDRAKVNPIVGQAGVAAGEGAVGATVQRITEAGHTAFYNLDVDESEDAIKGSAGTLQAFQAINRTAAPLYLKFYNATTGNTTVGSTTPLLTFVVPANADSDGAGFVWNVPIRFDTAITIAATTGFADNDTGAPGANDLLVAGAYD